MNRGQKGASIMTTPTIPAWRRRIAFGMMALLLLSPVARAEAPQPSDARPAGAETADGEAAQPKFIWGIVLKFAAQKVFEVFFSWASERLFPGMAQRLTLALEEAVTPSGAATLTPVSKRAAPVVPKVTERAPDAPVFAKSGRENYQGAHLSLLVLQPDGRTLAVRPLSEGFVSGEKFRIRIGSTFEGELALDNIDPRGRRMRLYPASRDQVLSIKSGVPVILPLEPDSFFQFDDVAGEEKLIVSLRDPRAQGGAAAGTPVHRQENETGTGLLQEVAPGRYAAIAETIALQHR